MKYVLMYQLTRGLPIRFHSSQTVGLNTVCSGGI